MSEDQATLLNLHRLPARLDAMQAATLLGFQLHELSVLTHAGLLKPLGKPAPNGPKWYAAVEIEQKMRDQEFLHKATRQVIQYWKAKNAKSQKYRAVVDFPRAEAKPG